MSNVTIELVVKTATNNYRTIKPGDVVNPNEHVENKVTVNGDAKVFWLRSKDGPGKLSDPKRQMGGLKTHFGRIFAIETSDGYIYAWAGKNPESDEALQRVEELNGQEFEHVVGEAANETVATGLKPEPEPAPAPEVVLPNSLNSGIKQVLKYKKELESTRSGAKLMLHMDLLSDFGYSRAKKNNSREIQDTMNDLGIDVFPDIYRNPHSHLLLVLKNGYLQNHHADLFESEDPCLIMQEALERALS